MSIEGKNYLMTNLINNYLDNAIRRNFMKLTTDMQSGIFIVRIAGELDLSSVSEFRQTVDKVLNNQRSKYLLMNLEQLTFIDSSGLGAILGRYKKVNLLGGKILVTNVQPQITRIFELSGLLKILAIYPTEAEALEQV
jgi:stage II sporulation protein AA (anti-sigma F factor antagonist)